MVFNLNHQHIDYSLSYAKHKYMYIFSVIYTNASIFVKWGIHELQRTKISEDIAN